MNFRYLLPLAVASTAFSQQPWQHLQDPTVAQVAVQWKSPPPEYGPEPYYGMNGPMTREVVARDLDTMKALGYQAVTAQSGKKFPYAYLSEEYFTFFRMFVDEAKKRNMRVWIVDDAGYPSGFVGGKISELAPDLRMQALVVTRIPVAANEAVSRPFTANMVSALAVDERDGTQQSIALSASGLHWTAPATGNWTVLLVEHQFRTSPTRSDTNPTGAKDATQSLEDYLHPAATRWNIEFTHEAYKKHLGDEFGKTIMGFRGDEPDYSINGLPWTPAFFDRFQQIKGYDVRPYVASFFLKQLTPEQARIKADYYDVFSRLFRDGYFKVQGDWCAANHLEYQVHLNHEEMELELTHSEGDFFRDMSPVQVPGIDSIWHQIFPDTISDFPRLASSAAHVYGKPRAFTESFAAYRPTPSIADVRYGIDEQLVRGINLIEIMYFPSSSAAPRASAPSFMGDPGFPDVLHAARSTSYLMSMGRPAAHVALYLPSSSLWLRDEAADRAFVSTERLLSEHQIDFDIVDEDALATGLSSTPQGLRTLSGNTFTTVILPGESILSEAALTRLRTFAKSGGKVLFLDHTPDHIFGRTIRDARPSTPADFAWASVETSEHLAATPTPPAQPPAAPAPPQNAPDAILKAVMHAVGKPDIALDTPDLSLRVNHRELKDASVYLLFNESATPMKHTITIKGAHRHLELWNAPTGSITSQPSKYDADGLHFTISLAPYQSTILLGKL